MRSLPMSFIPQGTDLLAITQDRLLEKSFLETNNIVIAPYATIVSPTDIQDAIDGIGYPLRFETTRGGYDGKGAVCFEKSCRLGPCNGSFKRRNLCFRSLDPI